MLNKDTLFHMTKSESKADSTTRVVKELVQAQTSERETKTQRLRAARLARDEADRAERAANPPKKAPAKRRTKPTPGN